MVGHLGKDLFAEICMRKTGETAMEMFVLLCSS